jgi:hypothetical protein
MSGKVKKKSKPRDQFIENMANPDVKNQTEAYQDAYGCDEATARVNASRLLANANILESINNRKKEVAKHAKVTPEQVIGATALRAFATIDDAFDDDGNFSMKKARETGAVHLIKKITRARNKFGVTVSVEFYSNETAQDKLGNYLGLEKAPQANSPEIDAARALLDSLVNEKGYTRNKAIKVVLEAAKLNGVELSEEDILDADTIG